jgi:dephospho-CoA kinase
MPRLVVLTGASGSGKTTMASAIAARAAAGIEVLRFDSIGIPPIEEMIADYGSGEAWQRAKTIEWMKQIAGVLTTGVRVIFEGQMRVSFIEEAIASAGIRDFRIILVDCDDESRRRRLVVDRAQPELANPTMTLWAQYLRNEAVRGGYEILDTSRLTNEACVERVLRLL